jgi:hypothetical protein
MATKETYHKPVIDVRFQLISIKVYQKRKQKKIQGHDHSPWKKFVLPDPLAPTAEDI